MTVEHTLTADINPTDKTGDIIPSVSVERIIAQRNAGISALMEGIEKLREAKKLFAAAAGKDWFTGLDDVVTSGMRCYSPEEIERNRRQAARNIDTSVWTRLMKETGMLTLMSNKQQDAWTTQLYSEDCPEISMSNVLSTFGHLNASKRETFEMGIIDVFRSLSWDYNTNIPCRLGKRMIIDAVLSVSKSQHGANQYASVTTKAQSKIDDLARAFYLLENRNIPDSRVSEGIQYRDYIYANQYTLNGIFSCEWFSIRTYWKGSAHVTFTRPDLVEKINDIVAQRFPNVLASRV